MAPTSAPPRPVVVAAAAVVVAVWLLAVGFRLGHWPPFGVDAVWNRWMTEAADPVALVIARTCDVLGTGAPAVAATIAGALLVARRRGRAAGLVVLAASAVSELDVLALKVVATRPRPSALFSLDRSFPSGHTANAAVLTVVVALLLNRAVAWVLAVGWIVLMGWSRTFLHAHWLSDVLAGAVLGAATALLVVAGARLLRRRAHPPAGPGTLIRRVPADPT